MKTIVLIESPFKGDIEKNYEYWKKANLDAISRNEVPMSSHFYYTQFLDDTKPEDRKLGISLGYDLWRIVDKIVFYTDLGMSDGMQKAFTRACIENKPMEYRELKV